MSCKQKPAIPSDVLAQDKMPLLIAELQLVESQVARLNLQNFDSSKVAFKYLEHKTLAKYGVDTAQYRKSYEFYATYPEYMQEIYDKAVKLLEAKKDSTNKVQGSQTSRPTQ